MEDELKKGIEGQEKSLKEKELEIAALKKYLEGVKDGYVIAKGEVIEILQTLPIPSPNIDSITYFFGELTKVINNIKKLELKK